MLASSPPPPLLEGRYFVTGAGGFIGAHLVRRLTAARCEVVAADLTAPADLPAGATFVRCDLRDRASVVRAVQGCGATRAVHLAAKVGDRGPTADYEAVNVTGTEWLLDALLDARFEHIIHVSTVAVHGPSVGERTTEGARIVTEGSRYAASKARGELAARKRQVEGAPITIVRPGDVYGVGSVAWVERPIELMRKRQMVLVEGGRGRFAHLHIDNLLDALSLVFASPVTRGETYLLTDGDMTMTFVEYFGRLADAVGLAPPSVSLPAFAARALAKTLEAGARVTGTEAPFTAAMVDYVLRTGSFDVRKAREALSWTPRVMLESGLREIGRRYGRLVT